MSGRRKAERSFTSPIDASLEALGFARYSVVARLEGSRLLLEGDEAGTLEIAAAEVDRLRQFRMEAVHSLYAPTGTMFETKIWWQGRAKPVLLIPAEGHEEYRRIIRDFAAAVAAGGGLGKLRLGPGYFTGIVNLLIVGVPTAMLFAGALALAYSEGGWWWLAAAGVFMLFFWLAGRNIVSRWPRPVRSFDDFEAELEWR